MKRKKARYYSINFIIFSIAVAMLVHGVYANVLEILLKENLAILAVALCGSAFIYLLKAVRIYLIMLEKRMTVKRFIKVYMKTTLVNLALPFKLGEIFRFYCYGNEMNSYKGSFLCVMIDRYFDTVPLIMLLLGFTVITSNVVLPVVVILLFFIILVTVAYKIFPSTYRYLNKFFIIGTNSKKGIRALILLDRANEWYKYATELIKGRGMILLILSCITWLMEYGILAFLAWGLNDTFKMNDFIDYMNSVFVGSSNLYVALYVGIGAILIIVGSFGIYGISLMKGENR